MSSSAAPFFSSRSSAGRSMSVISRYYNIDETIGAKVGFGGQTRLYGRGRSQLYRYRRARDGISTWDSKRAVGPNTSRTQALPEPQESALSSGWERLKSNSLNSPRQSFFGLIRPGNAWMKCRPCIRPSLAKDLAQSGAKRLNIVALKRSELPQDQPLFDRGENRLVQRRLRHPRALPVADQPLAKRSGGPKNLTRDSHHDHVRSPLMIRVHADNDGRSLLRSCL